MNIIKLEYPLQYFNIDKDLYNVIVRFNGSVINSGAGFGTRDMEILFPSQKHIDMFLSQIPNFIRIIDRI